jgi:hypothetical protein
MSGVLRTCIVAHAVMVHATVLHASLLCCFVANAVMALCLVMFFVVVPVCHDRLYSLAQPR